jgi:hypothetical protein
MLTCAPSLSFPAGKHDDQVDALGLVGQLLAQMTGGSIFKEEAPDLARKDYQPAAEERNVSDSILLRQDRHPGARTTGIDCAPPPLPHRRKSLVRP